MPFARRGIDFSGRYRRVTVDQNCWTDSDLQRRKNLLMQEAKRQRGRVIKQVIDNSRRSEWTGIHSMESSQCWVKVCSRSDLCSPSPAGTWLRFKTGILSTRSEQNLLRINMTGCLSLTLRCSVVGGFLGQTGIPIVVFCFWTAAMQKLC